MADAAPGSARRAVGRVVGCWRYPVKSMGAEALDRADVSWFGVAGDRRWAFVRPDSSRSGFPWLTLREHAALGLHRARYAEPDDPEHSATRVRTPDGRDHDVADPALAAGFGLGDVRVMRQDRGVHDTFPLSLLTTQTLAGLGRLVGRPLDVARFRPNLLIDAPGGDDDPEDRWVGAVLAIGTLRLRVDKRDGRCVVITIDPPTGERDPEILRAVARQRQGCLGVYGSTVAPGRVQVGDTVWIE